MKAVSRWGWDAFMIKKWDGRLEMNRGTSINRTQIKSYQLSMTNVAGQLLTRTVHKCQFPSKDTNVKDTHI